jgi:hypothetical protein
VVIGVLFFLFAMYNLVYVPSLDPAHPDQGWLWLTSDPEIIDYIKFYFRVQGVWQVPLAILVIFAAVGGLRTGQRWAWYAFWYIPIHFLVIWVLMPWIVVVLAPLFLLAVAALIFMIPVVFEKGRA